MAPNPNRDRANTPWQRWRDYVDADSKAWSLWMLLVGTCCAFVAVVLALVAIWTPHGERIGGTAGVFGGVAFALVMIGGMARTV